VGREIVEWLTLYLLPISAKAGPARAVAQPISPEAPWPRRDRKWTAQVFAVPANLVVSPEPEFESENALGLL